MRNFKFRRYAWLSIVFIFILFRWVASFGEGDVGPFYGRAAERPNRKPDQSFKIYDGFTLEVFDPNKGQQFSIVSLVDADKHVRWSICADEDGSSSIIRFTSIFNIPGAMPRVKSKNQYSNSSGSDCDRAIWIIGHDGSFQGYSVWT